MIHLEDAIIELLGAAGEVDGHDVGSGEMNVFIDTNEPERAFRLVRPHLESAGLMATVKVAFRDFAEEAFTILYPADETVFSIV